MRSKLWPKFSKVQSISKVAEIVFLAAFWHLQYIHDSCIDLLLETRIGKLGFISGTVSDVMPFKPPCVKIDEGVEVDACLCNYLLEVSLSAVRQLLITSECAQSGKFSRWVMNTDIVL
jgi:hypothetical protein